MKISSYSDHHSGTMTSSHKLRTDPGPHNNFECFYLLYSYVRVYIFYLCIIYIFTIVVTLMIDQFFPNLVQALNLIA